MVKYVLSRIVLYSCVFYSSPLAAQNSGQDSSLTALQVGNAVKVYNAYTNANLPLYNGRDYIPYTFKKEGNPFFESDSITAGMVNYAGRDYQKVPMLFDIARNELVIVSYDDQHFIVLDNDKVDSFHIRGHAFIRLVHNDSLPGSPPTGFYDRLYNGNIKVWAGRTKTFQESTAGGELIRIFSPRNYYYIFSNNTYYAAKNKKDILAIMSDKRHEMKKFSRKQKLKFNKKGMERAIVAVATYYDRLNRLQ
ncbi:MAG TPA: hypothetical protein VIU45_01715 [Chitinophagaceae bacterium]